MTNLKTTEEITKMREGGRMLGAMLRELAAAAEPGMTTGKISAKAAALIKKHGVEPSFLHYNGYPDVICVSVNHQAVHTPGSKYVLKDGDLLKLDFGIVHKGMHTDSAITVLVGDSLAAKLTRKYAKQKALMKATREALEKGIAQCVPGNRLGDIGAAVQKHVEAAGFTVVRELGGHGIGHVLHDEPFVANIGKAGTGARLQAGMVLALEPITSMGGWKIRDGADGHTYEMADGTLSAHFEHTVAITEKGPEVLTR